MRHFIKVLLPVMGLALFTVLSLVAVRNNERIHDHRYFFWGPFSLDRTPRAEAEYSGTVVTPGKATNLLLIAAFPAFVVGMALVAILGSLGISHFWTFFAIMPILIGAWFYFVGSIFDRLVRRYVRDRRPV